MDSFPLKISNIFFIKRLFNIFPFSKTSSFFSLLISLILFNISSILFQPKFNIDLVNQTISKYNDIIYWFDWGYFDRVNNDNFVNIISSSIFQYDDVITCIFSTSIIYELITSNIWDNFISVNRYFKILFDSFGGDIVDDIYRKDILGDSYHIDNYQVKNSREYVKNSIILNYILDLGRS